MLVANILAGGSGIRMGTRDNPKQFLILNDKPIIIHTLMKFLSHKEFDYIILAVHKHYFSKMKELIDIYIPESQQKNILICEGGESRIHSIINSVEYVSSKIDSYDFTMVTHDGVRPFVDSSIIKRNIHLMQTNRVVTTVINAVDTIMTSDNGVILKSIPDRKMMYQSQTPQSFNAKDFIKIINEIENDKLTNYTDACGIFLFSDIDVVFTKGSPINIKITTPHDLIIARSIICDNN